MCWLEILHVTLPLHLVTGLRVFGRYGARFEAFLPQRPIVRSRSLQAILWFGSFAQPPGHHGLIGLARMPVTMTQYPNPANETRNTSALRSSTVASRLSSEDPRGRQHDRESFLRLVYGSVGAADGASGKIDLGAAVVDNKKLLCGIVNAGFQTHEVG